ncbi:hypothetical protein [Roseovarius confluentis]|uniref:hypothetical protein n=1 Tax=Roseovarius confluentis TaxID=1852027 RepID=UPI003BA92A5C
MTAFNPSTHKLVTASGANLGSAAPVDGRVALARLLQTSGFADIKFGNSAPGDTSKLWHHDSQNTIKRWNPLTGGWSALTEGQFALWMHSKMVGSASPMPEITEADRVMMQDVSSGEARYATVQALMAAGGNLGSGFLSKVAETKVTSQRQYVEVSNIAGAKMYLVRLMSLQVTPAPSTALPLYMQLGTSSGWLDEAGDYHDVSEPHLQINPQPQDSPTGVDYMSGGAMGGFFNPGDFFNAGGLLLKFMNDGSKRTAIRENTNEWQTIMLAEEDLSQAGGGNFEAPIRTAASAENRLRFFTDPGYQFVGGKLQVYAVGA